jgi:hypothetical protein
MGYGFVSLPIEAGGHQSEGAEQFLDRLVKYAGSAAVVTRRTRLGIENSKSRRY